MTLPRPGTCSAFGYLQPMPLLCLKTALTKPSGAALLSVQGEVTGWGTITSVPLLFFLSMGIWIPPDPHP